MKTVLWSFGLVYDQRYKTFAKRILAFYETEKSRRNIRMVFEYLKDCYTIIQFNRAGSAFQDLEHHVVSYLLIVPFLSRQYYLSSIQSYALVT